MGCGGCNPLEGIDCYTLKCTKITLFARISVLLCFYNNTFILLYVLRWQVRGYNPPSPPKSATITRKLVFIVCGCMIVLVDYFACTYICICFSVE